MGQPSIYYENAPVQIADAYSLNLVFNVTAAVSPATGFVMTPYPANAATLGAGFYNGATAPTALTQAQIDNFLGTTSEFLLANFSGLVLTTSSTAMIINMGGQCKDVYGAQYTLYSSTGQITVAGGAAPTDNVFAKRVDTLGAVAANAIAVGADGNIGMQMDFATVVAAGMTVFIKVLWRPN
jgi:hypothetical protein